MTPTVASIWTRCNVVINTGVLTVYLVAFLVLKFKSEAFTFCYKHCI